VKPSWSKPPVLLTPGDGAAFPDPDSFGPEGLVAVGGDLTQERLLAAYACGVFPWFDADSPPLWWSPDPRAHLPLDGLRVSRSLARTVRRHDFELTWNRDFEAVMQACAEQRSDGTWITAEMCAAYVALHRRGAAHSLEVWRGGALVGGVYGVQVGGLFAAESKFHRATDMSKVALLALVRGLTAQGAALLDVQFATDHLRSLGVEEVSRREYLRRLDVARSLPVDLSDLVPAVMPG
jgi:leucyl/phenylalanyl-tRNA--protein transferase